MQINTVNKTADEISTEIASKPRMHTIRLKCHNFVVSEQSHEVTGCYTAL